MIYLIKYITELLIYKTSRLILTAEASSRLKNLIPNLQNQYDCSALAR